jgi:hypothetical protein
VALTFKKIESDPKARRQFIASFPDLPSELEGALDCPDFKKDSFTDKIQDLFKKKKIVFNKDSFKADRRKKSFLRRIFRK